MLRNITAIFFLSLLPVCLNATTHLISVSDPDTWSNTVLSSIPTGDTVRFAAPLIVNRNYGWGGFSGLMVSPRRVFSATNQELPGSAEYLALTQQNNQACFNLLGCGYHRNGERLLNLVGVVLSDRQVQYVSGTWANYNSRSTVEHTVPSVDINDTHNLLVCGANLEYYLVESLGTGYGPDNDAEHQRQRTKVRKALSTIHADLYGLVEIEQGQSALAEIAADLTSLTGTPYDYINDQGSVSGSYTKSGYVYRSDRLQPFGLLKKNNTVVSNRKMVQGFVMLENNERFIYSINHFKAKSGSGTGRDADQGDGQGIYNYSRTREAQSIISNVNAYQNNYDDNDMLMMGDLNAYAKEDPIRVFTDNGFTDLHRLFHADTSYSYVYSEQAGYLDHALANQSLIKQVTGLAVWHVNSDESDNYTYDKSTDLSVFRYSDHDPVLVGLKLDSTLSIQRHEGNVIDKCEVILIDGESYISNLNKLDLRPAYYAIYTQQGLPVTGITPITQTPCPLPTDIPAGIYIVQLYYASQIKTLKFIK